MKNATELRAQGYSFMIGIPQVREGVPNPYLMAVNHLQQRDVAVATTSVATGTDIYAAPSTQYDVAGIIRGQHIRTLNEIINPRHVAVFISDELPVEETGVPFFQKFTDDLAIDNRTRTRMIAQHYMELEESFSETSQTTLAGSMRQRRILLEQSAGEALNPLNFEEVSNVVVKIVDLNNVSKDQEI